MMFNIKIKDKAIAQLPRKSTLQKANVFSHTRTQAHTCAHTHSHKSEVHTEEKQVIYSIKWQMYSKKTHQTKCEVQLL